MRPLTAGDRSIHLVASVGTCALALALVVLKASLPRLCESTPPFHQMWSAQELSFSLPFLLFVLFVVFLYYILF